jgi:hypothetical protein
VILVPGEDSSTGNVTGGRKLARCVLQQLIRVLGSTLETSNRNVAGVI